MTARENTILRMAARLAVLSTRQGDVASLVYGGLSNKEIARAVSLSEATVKLHVKMIMAKIGARHRTDIALAYMASTLTNTGWIDGAFNTPGNRDDSQAHPTTRRDGRPNQDISPATSPAL